MLSGQKWTDNNSPVLDLKVKGNFRTLDSRGKKSSNHKQTVTYHKTDTY